MEAKKPTIESKFFFTTRRSEEGALASADVGAKHAARCLQPFVFMADRGPDHANPVLDHHRDVQPVEPAWVARVAVMKLADGFNRYSGVL